MSSPASEFSPLLGAPATGVIITGGASGLGLASAQALAAVGRPVALWDINAAGAAREAAAIHEAFGVPAIGIGADLRNPQAIVPAVNATRDALPSIGGLVHAAGTAEATGIEGVTPDNWDAGLNVHLRPIILITQALLEDFRKHPGAAIVAFASINASIGDGAIPIYTAAKGGVLALVRSMADTLAHDNIRINAVSPGVIDTPMIQPARQMLPENWFESRPLLGRLGQPAEIGRLVRFLLSDEASYITAAEFVADGGNISSSRR